MNKENPTHVFQTNAKEKNNKRTDIFNNEQKSEVFVSGALFRNLFQQLFQTFLNFTKK